MTIKERIDQAFEAVRGKLGDDGRHDKHKRPEFCFEVLCELEIDFSEFNQTLHLVLECDEPLGLIDFWPTTGKWIKRNDRSDHRRGFRNLLREILLAREERQND
jgi:hypothetical protein